MALYVTRGSGSYDCMTSQPRGYNVREACGWRTRNESLGSPVRLFHGAERPLWAGAGPQVTQPPEEGVRNLPRLEVHGDERDLRKVSCKDQSLSQDLKGHQASAKWRRWEESSH